MRHIKLRVLYLFAFAVLLLSCKKEDQLFEKLDQVHAGIQFDNKLTPTNDFNIIDYIYFYNGGGVSIGDINGDGLVDIFFAGNQVKNKLYLNKGNLQFEDISHRAGVEGASSWNTGSVMGDVNGDGLLDIYVCAVVGLKNLKGHNELYINNGDNTFTERSVEFGLDYESYSSAAAFLDYDLDGDLDIFLSNHAIHTQESFGHADLRKRRTYESGGKLLRNDGGLFKDVSEQAGIYGGANGYGLGLAISDFNTDGYPDIYVGNDFHEDDYLYLNNADGTFTESGKEAFTMTSKFSMGNDAADINHDGLPDLISLDMLPDDESILKRSVDDENISILKMRTNRYGYNYQFPRNMLQINRGKGKFSETALMSGVAATDWSWSALFSDFDQDGHQDLFISNGIPRRPNDLDYIKYVSSEQVVNKMETTKLVDEKALSLMPSGMAQNVIFKGSGLYKFEEKTKAWLPAEMTCSTATAFGDLDNDGDLDLVINNVDSEPGIFINQINKKSTYLKLKLNFNSSNSFGVGSRVYTYHKGLMQYKELYTSRGFQASSEPIIHFGFGDAAVVDSIKIIWPDGQTQKLTNINTNQTLSISPSDLIKVNPSEQYLDKLFEQVNSETLGINYKHIEDDYTDFDRLKLLPYQQSDRGPAVALGDINDDGRVDIYFGGSKRIPGSFFIQTETGFNNYSIPIIEQDSIKEDVEAIIDDFSGDGKPDLYVATGGGDFFGSAKPLSDSYYKSNVNGFDLIELEGYYNNSSCVKSCDFDSDGDLDLFVGGESIPNDFGNPPRSCLLENRNGLFSPIQNGLFDNLGMVTDAIWDDYDDDGYVDLIVVGEWTEPVFLKNNKGKFVRQVMLSENLTGLWQSIVAFDIDKDGDTDYILGNWGLNSRYRASASKPMIMYYNDFDANGKSETVIAVAKENRYYPLDGFDMLASQLPMLKKKYTNYESFAGQTIDQIFTEKQLSSAIQYKVHELASGYLRNDEDKFYFVQFGDELQLAPILAMLKFDFDQDSKDEVLVAGNYFGVQPFHGRFGSSTGGMIWGNGYITAGHLLGLELLNVSVRNLSVIRHRDASYLLVTINDDAVQIYKLTHE